MKESIIEEKGIILRHHPIELIEHWVLALSGLLLIFSGFGELPMYKRYMVTEIPGLGWAGDFFINLKIHYLSGIIFVSVLVFHVIYHGWLGHQGLLPKRGDVKASLKTILAMFGIGQEPKSHKYLPEQRLAYAYLGGTGLILVLTGLVKVIKNLPGVYLSPGWVTSMTLIHTFTTIFFLIGVMAHLAALVFKVNRPLAKSIFTRKVDLHYAKERHTIWYEELMRDRVKVEPRGEVEEREETGVQDELKAEGEVKDQKVQGIEEPKEGIMAVLKVKGMSCQHCVMSVTQALKQLEGIRDIQVDLEKGEVRFENIKGVASERIAKAISDAGYEVVQS